MLEQLIENFPDLISRLWFRPTRNDGGHTYIIGRVYAIHTANPSPMRGGRTDIVGKDIRTDETGNHIIYPSECDLIIPVEAIPEILKMIKNKQQETEELVQKLAAAHSDFSRQDIKYIDPKAEEIQALYDDLEKRGLSKPEIVARLLKISSM